MLEKVFKLNKHHTNIKTEIIAGITTFLSMAYILAVIPNMLKVTGMDEASLLIATAIASGIASILMGFIANYPLVLGPGLGVAALFAFNAAPKMGSWQTALAAVFVSGLVFLLISVTGIRKLIINAIPEQLKQAIGAGIGFFIAFIGLKNSGIIIADKANFVGIGNFSDPQVLLALFGILLTFALIVRKVPAAIFIGLIATAVVGLICGWCGVANMPSLPSSFKLDFELNTLGSFASGFNDLFKDIPNMLLIVFSFLFVDFFDTAGTLVATANRAELFDENGEIENVEKVLMADSIGTVTGAVLGVSTVTSFVESTSGIEVGGRTGLTAISAGICFLLSIFIAPLFKSLITSPVTTPALVCVGVLMSQQLKNINWEDEAIAASSFITILTMILGFSISNGIALGFITYTIVSIAKGKIKDLHYIIWILDIIFILYFIFLV